MASETLERIKLEGPVPAHVAVIMDGNGRWARARGLPRYRGHSAGMAAVRETLEGAIEAGIQILTLFAFSQENWRRPEREVNALMLLLQRYVEQEQEELKAQGVEVHVYGELDRLPSGPARAIREVQEYTAGGTTLKLNLMISYGARAELVRAARRVVEDVRAGTLEPDALDEERFSSYLYTASLPDPDLLIRTSGEMRISNFLLWQLAYTELFFSPVLWPDFDRERLFEAVEAYQKRERRFGRVSAS